MSMSNERHPSPKVNELREDLRIAQERLAQLKADATLTAHIAQMESAKEAATVESAAAAKAVRKREIEIGEEQSITIAEFIPLGPDGEGSWRTKWHPNAIAFVEALIGFSWEDREQLRPGNKKYGDDPFEAALRAIRERAENGDSKLLALREASKQASRTRWQAESDYRKASSDLFNAEINARDVERDLNRAIAEYEERKNTAQLRKQESKSGKGNFQTRVKEARQILDKIKSGEIPYLVKP